MSCASWLWRRGCRPWVAILVALLPAAGAARADHKITSAELRCLGSFPSNAKGLFNAKFVLAAESDHPCDSWAYANVRLTVTDPDGKPMQRVLEDPEGKFGTGKGEQPPPSGSSFYRVLEVRGLKPGTTVTLTLTATGWRNNKKPEEKSGDKSKGGGGGTQGNHAALSAPQTVTYKVTDKPPCVGHISFAAGDVTVNGKPAVTETMIGGKPAKAYADVKEGDVVATGGKGRLELQFTHGEIVRLGPNGKLEITEDQCEDVSVERGRRVKWMLIVGNIWAKFAHAVGGDENDLTLRSPGAIAGVRGTIIELSYDPAKKLTTLRVEEGKADFWNPKDPTKKVLVTAGQMSTVTGDGEPTKPSIVPRIFDWK